MSYIVKRHDGAARRVPQLFNLTSSKKFPLWILLVVSVGFTLFYLALHLHSTLDASTAGSGDQAAF